ncbi:LON peptidase substrate-binding domain-containing protein [Aquabacterium sp. A7-Y]|uniref:LON peptidase substrate-binding domain-containing protein n=1 Tax=Aquabacterium sp. A7-Y TaxID=1349605 RepID=UPI00223CFD64|nr:LON peptidase substrate-binding domain-containing protein [Aquabacterium sp. A7-Y]MCW7537489.1 LON peptidase substrate-binding domain-containing protein [Aquabacterium sp. A7-Y]
MTPLPLFPLQSVLFPDGLLGLKVFEARYLDLMSDCLREQRPFGVVALKRGQEVKLAADTIEFETVGCLAELIDVDSTQPGILHVRCRGTQRFSASGSTQEAGGLWTAQAELIAPDTPQLPSAELVGAATALARVIQTMKLKEGPVPFLEPYRFEDAGWIANRWCEILPIPLAARQKLMELHDPLVRLQLVHQFLRQKRILEA